MHSIVNKWLVVAVIMVGAHAVTTAAVNAERQGGKLQQKSPNNVVYTAGENFDFVLPTGPTPVGITVSNVTAVDYSSLDSGCQSADFAGFPEGNIALVLRGTCPFALKVLNAQGAGASGLLIANDEPGLLEGIFLGNTPGIEIPTLFITNSLGNTFAALTASGLRALMQVKQVIPSQ